MIEILVSSLNPKRKFALLMPWINQQLSSTIDGTVYAKIITPAGGKLPLYFKQMPVEPADFVE